MRRASPALDGCDGRCRLTRLPDLLTIHPYPSEALSLPSPDVSDQERTHHHAAEHVATDTEQ